MGFSLAGLLVSLAVLAPTPLLLRGHPAPARAPLVLRWLERAGQAGCLAFPALTGTAGDPGSWGWGAATAALVLGYHGLWLRYLRAGRRPGLLYAPLGPLPVPMAVLPVLVFLAAAAWLASWPTAAAAGVLALGHLPVSWLTARRLAAPRARR